MNIVFLGDVFGKPGRQLVLDYIQSLKEEFAADAFIINAENLADGKGLTEKTAKPLFEAGVTAMTSGNHLWDRAESHDYLMRESRIVKPMNYPPAALGNLFYSVDLPDGRLTVVCLSGQMFMSGCDYPQFVTEQFLSHSADAGCILMDFHAESTAEKRMMGFWFDGRISALIGTHTHVQTADEEILPSGTGYLTDAGMTGPHDSIIGIRKKLILQKMNTGMPLRYEVSDSGLQINGVFLKIDPTTRKTTEIVRIRRLINRD